MPNSQSAKKSLRQSQRKKEINLRSKVKMKKIIKSLNDLIGALNKKAETITSDKLKEIEESLKSAYKQIDKTAKNGIIKKNTASRKKSVLARKVNFLQEKISKNQ
jgi:small subunit ribosomal protein S20